MPEPLWIVHTALLALRRDLRYSLLAVVAIMFAVTSILSMGIVSQSIIVLIAPDPSAQLDGELAIFKDTAITDLDLAKVQELQQAGYFGKITPIVTVRGSYLKSLGGEELRFAAYVTGIDPSDYPLNGELTLASGRDLSSIQLSNLSRIS